MGGIVSTIGNAVGGIAGGLTGGLIKGAGLNNSYNAGLPDITKQANLPGDIQQAQQGYGGIQSDQNALAQALLAQSQGQGPNPAALQMQQAQDRANQQGAGLIASARGMNPALAARLASQQTAAGNQAVAQNTGIMGAQQQLAAQQQLGSLYGQQGSQNLNQQQILQGALANQNQAITQGTGSANQINAGVAAGNQQTKSAITGQLLGAAGSLAGMSRGGYVPGEAEVSGDSKSNDTVPARLSPGEIVVPRSAAGDADSAKAFIDHLMSEEKKPKSKRKAS